MIAIKLAIQALQINELGAILRILMLFTVCIDGQLAKHAVCCLLPTGYGAGYRHA